MEVSIKVKNQLVSDSQIYLKQKHRRQSAIKRITCQINTLVESENREV